MQTQEFRLAYEAYNDKMFRDEYYSLVRRTAFYSMALFTTATAENPLMMILANQAKLWVDVAQKYSKVNKENDKRWAKLNLEAYKICKEIGGIEQFNKLVKDANIDFLLTDDNNMDIDENIAYYMEGVKSHDND